MRPKFHRVIRKIHSMMERGDLNHDEFHLLFEVAMYISYNKWKPSRLPNVTVTGWIPESRFYKAEKSLVLMGALMITGCSNGWNVYQLGPAFNPTLPENQYDDL